MNIYEKNRASEEQLEFSFMDEIREEQSRPKTELKFFPNPKNDNEIMFNLQKKFYEGDEDAFWELWQVALLVANRMIKTKAHSYHLNDDEIEDKTEIAVEYVLRRLKYGTGYVITTNWITAIEGGVRHALEHKTKAERLVQYVDWETMTNYEWGEE